jgi:hypothetical protein
MQKHNKHVQHVIVNVDWPVNLDLHVPTRPDRCSHGRQQHHPQAESVFGPHPAPPLLTSSSSLPSNRPPRTSTKQPWMSDSMKDLASWPLQAKALEE